jgi:RNA polymerase sigma factor (sigma-70 family)
MMGPEKLGRLVDELAGALTLFARQWCASPEDVVQEAFVRLAAQRQPPDNLRAWLYTVVRNAAISAGRSERRRREYENAAAASRPTWFVPADNVLLDAEMVAGALETLPGEQRETLVAHLWGGLTFAQVGALTHVSASTANRRYLLALERLRERLRVECPRKI